MKFTNCVTLVGSKPKRYEGTKRYVSTGALAVDHIDEESVELVGYEDRPSRADLTAESGDVLFAKMADTKKTILLDKETAENIYSTGFFAVRAKQGMITAECLYYLLTSDVFLRQKNKHSSGATQRAITNKGLEAIDISIPNLDEQTRLVAKLDALSRVIKSREQQLVELDNLIKARFVELFGMPGTDAFGWGLVPLGSICVINPKKSQDKRLSEGIEVSFVPMPAVTESGQIEPSTVKKYEEVKSGFTYFAEEDVLFAKITPCMENGKGAVAKGLCNGIGFGSTEFHVLRPVDGKTNPYWIYILTVFPQFREDAAANMTGSAGQRRVPASFLETYKVALPPIKLQEQFAAFVEQTDKSKVVVQKALEEAQLLFDSLMQEYFG